jgi:hypothetical protein
MSSLARVRRCVGGNTVSSPKQWAQIFAAVPSVLLLGSCRDPTIWSTECRSPDSAWVATARTVEHGGFGTAGVETIVEVKRPGSSSSPERVLAFADGGLAIHLRMNWDGPTHLSVVYDSDPQNLYYQVVKTSGIEISVQNHSTGLQRRPAASTRP